MKLQVTLGKEVKDVEVTPLVDQQQVLYFLIQLGEGQMIVARHLEDKGKWLQAAEGKISNALRAAIFKKIEKASAYILLDKIVKIDRLQLS